MCGHSETLWQRPELDSLTSEEVNLLAKWLDSHLEYRETMRHWNRLFGSRLPIGTLVVMVLGGDWRSAVGIVAAK